ncbi:MAG TPA: hypothetical protein VKV19_15540 [Ktedonobacteraceae bacterium]|jgi:hypothetical protein|nr:hypothetical protein [Ktedonobacteraceae bacterium]
MQNISSRPASEGQQWNTDEVIGQEPEQGGALQWWYTLTAPPPVAGGGSFVQREAERKARSLSSVAAFFLCVLLLFLPACFFMGTIIIFADSIAIVGTLIGLVVNRLGGTRAAGIIIVLGAEIALGVAILLKGPFQPADIQLYDLYALIILLVASLLPPRALFLFAAAHSAFIIVELYIHPDVPALAQNLQPQAQLLPAIVRSVGLQLLGSTVAYVWVRSATRAIERANRAEMVAALEHTIAQERASSEQAKQELEESIQMLIQAQMAATKGQMTNQLPYPPAKVLWPLVGAMNLLWTRFQRSQQIEREHQHLQQMISSYIQVVQKDRYASLPLAQTGTILDQLILAAQPSRSREMQQDVFHSDSFRKTGQPRE